MPFITDEKLVDFHSPANGPVGPLLKGNSTQLIAPYLESAIASPTPGLDLGLLYPTPVPILPAEFNPGL